MNWGIKIFAVYGLFVALMIFMVSLTMKHDVNLVAPDYYAKELVFQGQIDKAENLKKLNEKVIVKIEDGFIKVALPKGLSAKGSLYFFRPSDSKLDLTFALENSELFEVPLTDFSKGMYRLKAEWAAEGVEYYSEEIVVIP
jgi:hypothetical protein